MVYTKLHSGYALYLLSLLKNGYRRWTIEQDCFHQKDRNAIMLVQQKEDGIFISEDKYVAEILKKFDFANIPDRSLLMYLTASRPDIMYAVCACSRFQVTPKTLHLHAVKRIFRYLKGKPKLGLWYPRVSPSFDLEAYSDSDYAGANLPEIHNTSCHSLAGDISHSRLELRKLEKSGRKNAKPRPTLDAFDDLDADLAHGMDYMETEEAVKEESGEKGINTFSTARPEVYTARPEVHTTNAPVSIVGLTISTADPEVSVVEPRTPPTTTSIFDDEDITMAQTLIKMKEEKAMEKGVAFKDVEDSSRPVRSITTLKPLLSIDPKDKGKGVLEEPEPAKKMTRSDFDATQVSRDAEVSKQLEVELQAEVERERQREEQESMNYIANLYNEVQAIIDVDHELAEDERLIQKMNKKAAGVHVEEVLKEPDSTKVKIKLEEAEQGTKKTPDERKIESMNKEDAGESNEKVSDVSKKRKGGPRMKRQSKRKKTDSDLEEEGHLKTFLKIVPDEEGIIDFENCGVHTLTLEDGNEIHMLAERKYSLTKETLKRMISLKLITKSASDSAYDLLRFIQKQIGKVEAKKEEEGSLKQTAFVKDFSNPLMADSLPKTLWFSTHHASPKELATLAIPEQTATGKRNINCMAGSVPKKLQGQHSCVASAECCDEDKD
ncbi:hypothetical protein Tco_1274997 [Tanacetum coccineum]